MKKIIDTIGISEIVKELKNKLGKTDSAASAQKLATARNINGVLFDGTKDITIQAEATVFDEQGKLNYPNGTKEWIE